MSSPSLVLPDQPVKSKSLRCWLEIALIFAVFFVAGGAPVPHVNETHYLAKAKQYWQPDWCAGDLFLESGKAHLSFYWTVGVLTNWFELPTVAWIGRVAAWLALAISWQRLNRFVTNLHFRAVLTAMLFVTLIDWTNFAGEWVVGGVEGKCFAYAFVFLGLAELASLRWRRVWPCLGLASAFHVLVGGWATVAAGIVWLWQPRGGRTPLLAMSPALLLGAALALPGVLPALQLTQTTSPEIVERANQIYVFDRLPHHLSPLTMRSPELLKKSVRFGILLVGFAVLRFLGSRTVPIQKARFQALDLVMQFALATLLISVAGLAWEMATWNHPELGARVLKFYLFRLADVGLPIAVSLGVVWLADAWIQRRAPLATALLIAATVLPALHLLAVSRSRLETHCPPADRKLADPAGFREACGWVREHTPPDALFLVPRNSQSFKWHTGRSDLVTWKDVPQSPAALLEWQERMRHVHRYIDEEGNIAHYGSLASQGTERIHAIAEKYKLDYVLTVEYPPLLMPIVYANDSYTIYSTATEPTQEP